MVLVDDRVGSRELLRPLRRAGCKAQLQRLEFGDVAFTGIGPNGIVKIGVERKKVDEMVGAITDPRFASRQLPGMIANYGMSWLIIEGSYRQGQQGELLVGYGREAGFTRQRFLYDTFEHFLQSIEIQTTLRSAGRFRVKRTQGIIETVSFIHALYTWWQKRWRDHSSFKVVDEASASNVGFEEQSFKRSVAAQLPGVYHTRSAAAAASFSSILHMITAGERRWRRVDGIGPKTAKKIVRCIREKS